MSEYDGVLHKTWEVHCRACERPALGLRGEKPSVMSELRGDGWRTRRGLWICPACAPVIPEGHDFRAPLANQEPG
jgi:hypothetical protein